MEKKMNNFHNFHKLTIFYLLNAILNSSRTMRKKDSDDEYFDEITEKKNKLAAKLRLEQ